MVMYMMFRSAESVICAFDHRDQEGNPNYYQIVFRIIISSMLFVASLISGLVWLTWQSPRPY